MNKTYRSIFVSDVHLGTKDSQADKLNNFLKHNSCDTLYLVGDIIDAWRIQQNKWRWKQSHTNVVRRVLGHAKRGTRVVYVAGNHDEFLRPMIPYGFSFGLVEIHNQIEHIGADGKHYLVTHGDLFDGITRLSQYLKARVKKAVDFIFQFEKNLTAYCKKRGFDGVICGHIHHAEIKDIDGVVYMNDGDWVESCTALVEHWDGRWEIVTWTKESDNVGTDNISSAYKRLKRRAGTDRIDISRPANVSTGFNYN